VRFRTVVYKIASFSFFLSLSLSFGDYINLCEIKNCVSSYSHSAQLVVYSFVSLRCHVCSLALFLPIAYYFLNFLPISSSCLSLFDPGVLNAIFV